MDILVLGFGAVGSVLLHLLARESWVSSVTCGTIGAEMASRSLPIDNRIRFLELDCRDHVALGRAVSGHQVVINASLPNFNKTVMEACLFAGAHYQDLCTDVDDPPSIDVQLSLDEAFRKAGLTGLLCTGISPGITNVLAAEGASKMDVVHGVFIYHYESQVSPCFVPSWSTAIMMDQISTRPFVWRNCRYERVEPLSEPERVFFRGADRYVTVYMTVGDEPLTIPRNLKVDTVVHKMGGNDLEDAVVLKKYGLFGERPVPIPGGSISPRLFLRSLLAPVPSMEDYAQLVRDKIVQEASFSSRVKVGGWSGGKPKTVGYTVVYPDLRRIQAVMPGATYIAYPSAFSALAFTRLLPGLPRGVLFPEMLDRRARQLVLRSIHRFGTRIARS